MNAVHKWAALKATHKVRDSVALFTANHHGGYLYVQKQPQTRYHGFFCYHNNHLFRIIENIAPEFSDDEIDEVQNCFVDVKRTRDTLTESWWCPIGEQALVYELSKKFTCKLTLDMKKSYDNREWGRHYTVQEENGTLVISFTKTTHDSEDESHHQSEYQVFLAIKGHTSYKDLDKWVERHYADDHERQSPPHKRFVYDALSLGAKKLVFGVGWTKQEAVDTANKVFHDLSGLKQKRKAYLSTLFKNKQTKKVLACSAMSAKQKLAWLCAVQSLDSLRMHNDVFAGFPWFFQHWSRDSLVSAKALSVISPDAAKKVLSKYSSQVQTDGNIANHYHGTQANADSIGWWATRLSQLNVKSDSCTLAATQAVRKLLLSKTHDSFALNDPKSTWMDTSEGDSDTRSGVRIEIQAQRIAVYDYLYRVTKEKKYKMFREGLLAKVRSQLWNHTMIADGKGDFTVRPNLFIAAYTYPNLLTKQEWTVVFSHALDKLWCSWGGLTTIDKSHHLYKSHHTGENVASYHRGDSWFWINNLAALCMHKTNNTEFAPQIEQIVKASTHELLWEGALGCHAEVSCAAELKSQGCFNQAWSDALFIELIEQLCLES